MQTAILTAGVPIAYNMYLWIYFVLLVHKKLISKHGIAGAIAMYLWSTIISVISMTCHCSKFFQQLLYVGPIFIIASIFYYDRIQWKTIVIFLAQAMLIIPELLVESVLYFIYGVDPFVVLRQHPLYLIFIFLLVHVNYCFLKRFLEKIRQFRAMSVTKAAIVAVLSVTVVALMPLTYFFENVNLIIICLSFVFGIALDVMLLSFIFEFTRYRQVEKIQTLVQWDSKNDEKDDDLYELRHDIGNYTNALKILQKQKEGEEV